MENKETEKVPEMPELPPQQPEIPEDTEQPAKPAPERQMEKAAGSPAVPIILAVLGLLFAVAGAFGGFWLIAGAIGTALSVAAVIFAWKVPGQDKIATAALALAISATAISGFSLVTSAVSTVQDVLSPDVVYYDDWYGGYDDYGHGSGRYDDYYDDFDIDEFFNGYDDDYGYGDYWN